jgi:hypothetical protein
VESPPEVAGSFYASMPDDICDREDCEIEYQAILRALICFIREGCDHPTRKELSKRSKVRSLNKVIESLQWLQSEEAIEIIPDPKLTTRRRFRSLYTLRGRRFIRVEKPASGGTHKQPGARPARAAVPPQDVDVPPEDVDVPPQDGGARPARAPLPYRGIRDPDREKTDVPSVESATPTDATPTGDGDGRDGIAPLGGGEPEPAEGGAWEGPDPTPGELAALESARAVRGSVGWMAMARLGEWAAEVARRAAPPAPRPRPSSFVPGTAHAPAPPRARSHPRRAAPDEGFPLARAVEMIRAFDPTADLFRRDIAATEIADFLARRYRDPGNPITVNCYRLAVLELGPGQLEGELFSLERDRTVLEPARVFAHRLAMARKTPARAIGQDPRAGVAQRTDGPHQSTQGFTP